MKKNAWKLILIFIVISFIIGCHHCFKKLEQRRIEEITRGESVTFCIDSDPKNGIVVLRTWAGDRSLSMPLEKVGSKWCHTALRSRLSADILLNRVVYLEITRAAIGPTMAWAYRGLDESNALKLPITKYQTANFILATKNVPVSILNIDDRPPEAK